jgi:hypothetical protein
MASCSKAVWGEMSEEEIGNSPEDVLYDEMLNGMRNAQSTPKEDEEDVEDRPLSTISSIQPDQEVCAINAAVNDAARRGAVPRQGEAVRRANTMFVAP